MSDPIKPASPTGFSSATKPAPELVKPAPAKPLEPPFQPDPVPLKSLTELPADLPPFVPAEPTFEVGEAVALVGKIVAIDNSTKRITVRLDTTVVGDNPYEVAVFARNLRKE